MFHTLQEIENIGIHISKDTISKQDIGRKKDLPMSLLENSEHVVKCYNYLNSDIWADFDPFMSNLYPTMSQITEINETLTRAEEEEAFQFVDDQLENLITEKIIIRNHYIIL